MTVYPNHSYLQSEDSPGLVDTHCHLDFEPLFSCLPEVLEAARQANVTRFIVPGVHPDGWSRIAELGRRYNGIFPAFGVHPLHADLANDAIMERLSEIAAVGVAIGEIGLDPAYPVPMRVQEEAFRKQLRLAVALKLPIIIHCRRAFQRTLQILTKEKADLVGGVMHAFSGSLEMAREFIRLGFVISLSGTITWESAVRPVTVAREVPINSIVLETDAPNLTPQAFRRQSNQPAWLTETLLAAAKIRGMLATDIIHAAIVNSERTFKKLQYRESI